MLSWHYLILALVVLLLPVAADTDIVNFRLPLAGTPAIPKLPITTLTASEKRVTLEVSRDKPELWVALDTQTQDYNAWTARLSWPASTPTRFNTEVYPGPGGLTLLHIQASALSPRMHHPLLDGPHRVALLATLERGVALLERLTAVLERWTVLFERCVNLLDRVSRLIDQWGLAAVAQGSFKASVNDDDDFHTKFDLVLEPLVLGVIPKTALSAIVGVVLFAIGGACAVPYVKSSLQRMISRVDREAAAARAKSLTKTKTQ